MTTPGTNNDSPIIVLESQLATTPAPIPAPETAQPPAVTAGGGVPPPVGADLPADQELQYLRRHVQQTQAERNKQALDARLQQEAQAVYDEELAQGIDEASALRIAKRHYATNRKAAEQQQQAQERQNNANYKQQAAAWIGKQFGVDPAILMRGNSGEEMEAIAVYEKRISGLELQLKGLNMGQVPPQQLNNSNGSQASNLSITDDTIDKLWMDYERAHPNSFNPYTQTYRQHVGL